MLRGKIRHRKFLANCAKRLKRRELQFKRKHKLRLICKAKGLIFTRPPRIYKNCKRDKSVTRTVPPNFEVLNNYNETFGFIDELLDNHSNRKLKKINLDLTNIQTIDSAAICLLLSVVKELGYYGINVSGNYPQDEECARIFVESGFLNHMKNEKGTVITINTTNLIAETGTNKTRNNDIASAVRKGMAFIMGQEQRYQPAYTVAMEICSNSVEHAYKKRPKHWRLGIYNLGDRVAFTMADTGMGILKTLHRKFSKEIKDAFLLRDNKQILYRAFLRKYGSSTRLVNRNKGLPCILDKFQSGYIKNLKVITNDVYLDFENMMSNKIMNHPFSGVLFYWEVDKECVDKFINSNNNN